MIVLGIETSCDECSVAVVEDGTKILSNVIATQSEQHAAYSGVVPEIASRTHTEWIMGVYREALERSGKTRVEIDGIAVTCRPGLSGSLVVGLSFAKGLSLALGVPFVGVDHILAHLYAVQLEHAVPYPFLGVLVSGGHTMLAVVKSYDDVEVLGTTIDDACGEAFDKIAKHFDMGYPGGSAIDSLARRGAGDAYSFPKPSLHKGDHRYDVSYSGLKTAVVHHLEKYLNAGFEPTRENIAAAFEKTAVEILMTRVERALRDFRFERVVAGGGVAANTYFRSRMLELTGGAGTAVFFPSLELCTDNAAMVAGIGYHYLREKKHSSDSLDVSARVAVFRGRE